MKYYLFAMLPNIKILLTILCVILFVLMLCAISSAGEEEHTDKKAYKEDIKTAKVFFISSIILGLITSFIPNQKQVAFIVAAPYLMENQNLKDAGNNATEVLKLGTEYLKQTLSNEIKEGGVR